MGPHKLRSRDRALSSRAEREPLPGGPAQRGSQPMRSPRTTRRGKRLGRPRVPGSRLRHAARPELSANHPVHVTWHMRGELPSLRSPPLMAAIRRGFRAGKRRFGFRLIHFSVQQAHVHMICEADHAEALSRGLQGLAVRVAKGINRVLHRKGKVLDDRYHSRILRSPSQARWALGFVLNNARRENAELLSPLRYPRHWLDLACSSAEYFSGWQGVGTGQEPTDSSPIAKPTTWLLRVGWRSAGELATDHLPEPRAG